MYYMFCPKVGLKFSLEHEEGYEPIKEIRIETDFEMIDGDLYPIGTTTAFYPFESEGTNTLDVKEFLDIYFVEFDKAVSSKEDYQHSKAIRNSLKVILKKHGFMNDSSKYIHVSEGEKDGVIIFGVSISVSIPEKANPFQVTDLVKLINHPKKGLVFYWTDGEGYTSGYTPMTQSVMEMVSNPKAKNIYQGLVVVGSTPVESLCSRCKAPFSIEGGVCKCDHCDVLIKIESGVASVFNKDSLVTSILL